ncbi:GntR family transcriptional regulator [Streptomyces acidicola]|uniref:GntR family transcriptional regulator n=1 Tax=Streptomyces acidicola TaxID=2596892 RepID=UPI0038173304
MPALGDRGLQRRAGVDCIETKVDVRAVVREAIITGEFVPNQRLVEADPSERFGASRAAVRTALVQLTTEGLVERIPHRGARVRTVTVDAVLEITEG